MCIDLNKELVSRSECVSPESPTWLPWQHCFQIYEFRQFRLPGNESIEIRVKYEHKLCLKGRKQGPLAYTLTLLPQEQITLYHYERHRRVTSATARFSERTSFYEFTQKVSGKFQSRSEEEINSSTKSSGSVSGSGGLFSIGILSVGSASASMSSSSSRAFTDVKTVSSEFENTAKISAQAVETERSIVVSTFEEKDVVDVTRRLLRNDNQCRAVTYFVRRVFEVYSLSTSIVSIEVRVRGGEWTAVDALPDALVKQVKKAIEKLQTPGTKHDSEVEIHLPTDGLVYEPELAHCCSCEPQREYRLHLENEKLKAEIALMEQEVERRKALVSKGELGIFDPGPATVVYEDD
jgi:hypothetical protein